GCFQSDLLREHHVARDQAARWHEAPPHFRPTDIIQFVDVGHGPFVDAIALSAVRADDVEIAVGLELRALPRREPFAQKPQAARFARVLNPTLSVERPQTVETRAFRRPRSTKPEHDVRGRFQPPTKRGKKSVSSAAGSNALVRITS